MRPFPFAPLRVTGGDPSHSLRVTMPSRHSERSEESSQQDTLCYEPRFFEQPSGIALPMMYNLYQVAGMRNAPADFPASADNSSRWNGQGRPERLISSTAVRALRGEQEEVSH